MTLTWSKSLAEHEAKARECGMSYGKYQVWINQQGLDQPKPARPARKPLRKEGYFNAHGKPIEPWPCKICGKVYQPNSHIERRVCSPECSAIEEDNILERRRAEGRERGKRRTARKRVEAMDCSHIS